MDDIIIKLDIMLYLSKKKIIKKFKKMDPIKILNKSLKLLNLFLIHFTFGPTDINNKKNTTIGMITAL